MKTVAIAGTFDTKGEEFLYVKNLFEEIGINTLTINTGVFKPAFEADISNEEVIKAVGYDLKEIVEKKDRALATECLSKGMEILVPKLYKQGKFDGIISFGGSGGTSLVTPAIRGYEVLVFHATGTGGKTMESLIESGYFKGVLDLTTTEWCDEIVGGVLNAGPNRCEAAIKNNIPQVVSVGACDMVNFGPYNTIPEKRSEEHTSELQSQ